MITSKVLSSEHQCIYLFAYRNWWWDHCYARSFHNNSLFLFFVKGKDLLELTSDYWRLKCIFCRYGSVVYLSWRWKADSHKHAFCVNVYVNEYLFRQKCTVREVYTVWRNLMISQATTKPSILKNIGTIDFVLLYDNGGLDVKSFFVAATINSELQRSILSSQSCMDVGCFRDRLPIDCDDDIIAL